MTASQSRSDLAELAREMLPKILVVDDRPENLIAMQRVLSDMKVETLCAASGAEALSTLIYHQVAVILMDVEMPISDGFETAALIRGNEDTQYVPIIFITATRTQDAYFSSGYGAGAVDYLTKPINEDFLKCKLETFLEIHRQRLALQQKNQELEDAHQELTRSNDALADFASVASHDLLAPARQVRAFADILCQELGEDASEDNLQLLQAIQVSARRMQALVSSLLKYATLGASSPKLDSVNLNTVIAELLEDLGGTIEEAGAEVRTGECPPVRGDETLLRQLLQNLIGNAIKYHRPDIPPCIHIKFRPLPEVSQCEISVIDNGIGFDPAYAQRIFEPFRRLVGTREFEGSGIGMATAKKIVDLHGGEISATPNSEHGSTFTVILPVAS